MEKLFLSYKLSLLAKEKGFNEKCLTYYGFNKKIKKDTFGVGCWFVNKAMVTTQAAAPLYQQIVDWFREKHNMVIWVETATYVNTFTYRCYVETKDNKMEGFKTKDYYKSLNEAIEWALKNIK